MKHLPQSEIVISREVEKYYISTHLKDSKEVIIDFSLSSQENITKYVPGQKVSFFSPEDVVISYGLLRSINYETRKGLASCTEETIPYKCKITSCISIPVVPIVTVSNFAFIESLGNTATLSASCSYTEPHKAGQISWSLFYLPPTEDEEILIAKGHDFYSKGVCSFSKENSLWAEGNYTIKAIRYGTHKTTIKQDSVSWSLATTSNTLACGGYSSNQSSLFL